jgi:hypothetical protein
MEMVFNFLDFNFVKIIKHRILKFEKRTGTIFLEHFISRRRIKARGGNEVVT